MAAYEVLLLNTAIPQIQAAQSGDTYVVPRDIAFSTVASFAAGAEATPSIVATGDTNTGIWFPAADTVAISTGGTSRLRLDSSGNLGLGVTPSAWGGAYRAIQLPSGTYGGGSFFTDAGSPAIAANAYNDSGWKYVNADYATIYQSRSGQHQWYTAPSGTAGNAITFTQAMTLDADGDLGIGTTNPGCRIDVISPNNTSLNPTIRVNSNNVAVNSALAYDGLVGSGEFELRTSSAAALKFGTNNTEKARITSGGAFLIGGIATQIGSEKFGVDSGSGAGGKFKGGNDANVTLDIWNPATTGDNIFMAFRTETAETSRGTITYNRAGGQVAYNTTSDYRAKDLFGPVQNSGQLIDALKVYTGKMKGATIERPMLVAHEAQEHVPYAVTGEKDAVNEDGTPKYQQMDVSSLVPLLLAEIQSLRARVKALEGA